MSQSDSVSRTAFPSTRWSLIVLAGEAGREARREALDSLCRTYWLPVYAFIRRRTANVEDARDLTQEFFARLMDGELFAVADPARGRFRSLLFTAVRNFLTNEHERATAQKRGGGRPGLPLDFESAELRLQKELADSITAEKLFERQWAVALLNTVLVRLEREFSEAGRAADFEAFKIFLVGDAADVNHMAVAHRLGMTVAASRAAVYRLRKRYRELLREEIAQTVASESEVDDEIAALFRAFQS